MNHQSSSVERRRSEELDPTGVGGIGNVEGVQSCDKFGTVGRVVDEHLVHGVTGDVLLNEVRSVAVEEVQGAANVVGFGGLPQMSRHLQL